MRKILLAAAVSCIAQAALAQTTPGGSPGAGAASGVSGSTGALAGGTSTTSATSVDGSAVDEQTRKARADAARPGKVAPPLRLNLNDSGILLPPEEDESKDKGDKPAK